MKASIFLSSLFLGSAWASEPLKRAPCNADNCARALTGTYRGTALPSARRADCASFQQCTVYPATVTSTVTVTTFPVTQTATVIAATLTDDVTFTTIFSTIATATDIETVTAISTEIDLVTEIATVTQTAGGNQRRVVAPASFTTVCPSSVPSYASACSGSVRFASACSCAGVTKTQTSVLFTPTTTVTATQVGQTTITITTTALTTNSVVAVSSVTALTTIETTLVNVVTATNIVSQTTTVIVSAPTGNAFCQNGQPVNGLSAPCTTAGCSPSYLRIEGRTGTIYEGVILNGPASITLPSGGTHTCDGTNNNANSVPFANGITSIVAAGGLCNFGVDGTWSSQFQDFFIQTIGDTPSTGTQFWGILNNYQFTPAGGCETEILPTDELLWAFNAFNVNFFLRVQPTRTPVVLAPGQITTFTVEGTTGDNGSFQPISGASFAGSTSDGNGNVIFVAPTTPGTYRYKATRGDSIRSNAVTVIVQG